MENGSEIERDREGGQNGGSRFGRLDGASEDVIYRFPSGRTAIEPLPDTGGAFAVRLAWNRGKATIPVFESTPLRPVARIGLHGQTFPVYLSHHSRKKRDRIVLAGRRKTARSAKCALRFIVNVEGREDRLAWTWRIAATSAAMAAPIVWDSDTPVPDDEVALFFPFAPGRPKVLRLPDGMPSGDNILGVWMNDLVATVRIVSSEGGDAKPSLDADERGVQVTLRRAELGGHGVTLSWETWLAPARTEAAAREALLRHAAAAADLAQIPEPAHPGLLLAIGKRTEAVLMADKGIAKRGADRQAYRAILPATDSSPSVDMQATGEGVDAALTAATLLGRYFQSGDDALRRRARLISRGVCDFQVASEESHHWGAIWDAQKMRGGNKPGEFCDIRGEKTLSIGVAARAIRGLIPTHAHFGTEILERTANAAAQWLLLKLDRDARIESERFTEQGPPAGDGCVALSAAWCAAETLTPFIETFRASKNEVFLKAAIRTLQAFRDLITAGHLNPADAPTTALAGIIEGALGVARVYENPEMVAFARQIGVCLRVRRRADGSIAEPPGVDSVSPLEGTLAAARAALALARADSGSGEEAEPLWPALAYRATRAAEQRVAEEPSVATLADQASLCRMSSAILLSIAGRARGCDPDPERITITRGWQTFGPDPATREYIEVTALDGTPLDYLALICPVSLQALIAVIAPPDVTEARIVKNKRTPFVTNRLTGDFDQRALLSPLGSSGELNIGVFQADT